LKPLRDRNFAKYFLLTSLLKVLLISLIFYFQNIYLCGLYRKWLLQIAKCDPENIFCLPHF
jgi:hypothetical protein